MIKKAIISTAALALVGTFVFGRDVVSYVKTTATSVRTAVRSEVPMGFELERAREMVNNLMPDIKSCMRQIAEAEVDVEHRARAIARQEETLAEQKGQILTLKAQVDQGEGIKYVGRTYTPVEVEQDLARRFKRFKLAEQTLESNRKILHSREQIVKHSRDKLEGMLSSKRDLQVKIENLDARLQALQAAEAASDVNIDDSRLARAKDLIADLNKQLDVKSKMLDAEERLTPMIPVQTGPIVPENLSEQIDQYFELEKAETSENHSDA
jgi:chromosome segregation ATPase